MTNDRSLLLCHLQAGPLTFHRAGQAACARNLNTGAIHLPRGTARALFPRFFPERWGARARRSTGFWPVKIRQFVLIKDTLSQCVE